MNYFSGYIQPVQPVLHRSPFPLDSLPPEIYQTVWDVHERTLAPMPIIVASIFSAMSLVSQPLINVCCREELVSPVSLFSIVIAESGERKTTVDRLVMKPIYQQDADAASENLRLAEAFNIEYQIWETKDKAILRNISNKSARYEETEEDEERLKRHKNLKPDRPKLAKVLYGNTTAEALQYGMHANGASVGLVADEGGNIFDRKAINDLSFLNAIWDGVPFSVDRRTTDSFMIEDGRLTLSVMVQNAVFDDYLRRQGAQARGSGLFARCFFVRIDEVFSTVGQRFLQDRKPSTEDLTWFHGRMKTLISSKHKVEEPLTLKFTDDARLLWQNGYNWIENQSAPNGGYRDIKDFASKLANNIARLAALFHFFIKGDGDIDVPYVRAAEQICHWYAQQAISLFATDSDALANVKRAKKLLAWLQGKLYQNRAISVKKNHIRKCGPNAVRDRVLLDDALALLESTGHIRYWQHSIGKPMYVQQGINFFQPLII